MRQSEKWHSGLSGSASALSAITGMATRDDIFPIGFAPKHSRHDMIDIELLFGQNLRAVLTGESVAHKNLRSRKANMLRRTFVEFIENNDFRYRYFLIHGMQIIEMRALFWGKLGFNELIPRVSLIFVVDAYGNIKI